MSNRFSQEEDEFLFAYFDTMGDFIGTHDLGRSKGAATRRVTHLKATGAWQALEDMRAAEGRYLNALGLLKTYGFGEAA